VIAPKCPPPTGQSRIAGRAHSLLDDSIALHCSAPLRLVFSPLYLYFDYTMPIEPLRVEFTRILAGSPRWDMKVNVLQVSDASEHTLQVRALMSAADSGSAWDLRCEVREKLLAFAQKNYPECLPRNRNEPLAEATQATGRQSASRRREG